MRPTSKKFGTLGIEASMRVVEPVQYRAGSTNSISTSPSRLRLRRTPGCDASVLLVEAAVKGLTTSAGIASPVIDA